MTIKISRDGKQVGTLNGETLELRTRDRRLRQLFQEAKTEGLRVPRGATLVNGTIVDGYEIVKLQPRHCTVAEFMDFILFAGYASELEK